MGLDKETRQTIGLVKQGIVAGGYVVIALLCLAGAYWVYQNPETPGWVLGVGGIEVVLVGVAVVALYVATKKSPLGR